MKEVQITHTILEILYELMSPIEEERSSLKQNQWFRDEYCSGEERNLYIIHHQEEERNRIYSLSGYF